MKRRGSGSARGSSNSREAGTLLFPSVVSEPDRTAMPRAVYSAAVLVVVACDSMSYRVDQALWAQSSNCRRSRFLFLMALHQRPTERSPGLGSMSRRPTVYTQVTFKDNVNYIHE